MQVFEEAKRNQLVTVVDVQTQVALDEYQVQLSDITNPTQSQDNVVIDRFGEFLPHWNGSLDFDTWVKLSMEIAGKQLLMLHGNLNINSISNGDDTFEWYNNGFSGIYESSETFGSGYKLITRSRVPDSIAYMCTWADSGSSPTRWITLRQRNTGVWAKEENDGATTTTELSETIDSNYHICEIGKITGTAYFTLDGVDKGTLSTGAAADADHITNLQSDVITDWAAVAKFITTEPTYSIGAPKNISTALKSLGRAG